MTVTGGNDNNQSDALSLENTATGTWSNGGSGNTYTFTDSTSGLDLATVLAENIAVSIAAA
jgi:hypothetical protein